MHEIRLLKLLFLLVLPLINSCIGTDIIDDYVEARVALARPLDLLMIGESFQYQAMYFDNTGINQPATFLWNSSDLSVLEIDEQGLAMAIGAGVSTLSYTANNEAGTLSVTVVDPMVVDEDSVRMIQAQSGERTAVIKTVSSYPIKGSATLKEENGLKLILSEDFETTSSLPGLYLYLTNNTSTISNALEIGKVKAFSGSQQYDVPDHVQLQDYLYVLFYCKPFVVPVGNGTFEP